ncbi:MAG: alpha/beta hydrolase [Mycobacteriaceae bacterium]|uniref:alpha/beta hydrolase n=1 Tax=Corynebacterium sp. TaxID=1720 RepID=UPI003F9CD3F5
MKTAAGKHRSGTGTMGRKILALIVAIGTALGIATVAAPSAAADDRANLGPNKCRWSNDNYYVQNCWFYSNAMGQEIQVQIKRSNSNAAIYLLDGLRARQDWNGWTKQGTAHRDFVNDDVNVVMPVGGPSQFYADWVGPHHGSKGPLKPRWETFLTRELPAQLQSGFGISPTRNAIVGLSMGGTAAINLASRHRSQFKQATSLSGYLNTTYPGMYMALQFAMGEGNPGANVWDMWGHPFHPTRFENDPLLNAPKLSGLPVHISAAGGIPGPRDDFMADPAGGVAGIGLEWASRGTTATFELAARAAGARVNVSYPATGVHNWTLWKPELQKARPEILDALNICYRAGKVTC